ncbi:MAG TPA: hypothetical protein VEP90_26355 [Methylomirabilota bacterium]|nr:hypothetical protein [Methylomirabilota bacterium]
MKHEGEIFLDHRASPGFTEEQSIKLGLEGRAVGSTIFEAPTRTCNHCGTIVIINPDRKRDRATCFQCMRYICDECELARHQPGYIHITTNDVIEQILSRKEQSING